jgi:hypothetical protein
VSYHNSPKFGTKAEHKTVSEAVKTVMAVFSSIEYIWRIPVLGPSFCLSLGQEVGLLSPCEITNHELTLRSFVFYFASFSAALLMYRMSACSVGKRSLQVDIEMYLRALPGKRFPLVDTEMCLFLFCFCFLLNVQNVCSSAD